jgi:predicted GH43/DUF377 family glycosyl hydrolase
MVFHRLYPNVQYWFVPRFSDMTEELSPTHSTGLTHFHDSNRQRFWQYQAQPKVLERHTLLKPLPGNAWEGNHVSLSQAPIQLPNGYTDDAGWLAIYHGRDKQGVYRVGAALLDRNRPWIVTHRLPIPIMQPETPYETSPTSHQNFTITPNVMVPTGFTFDGTDILALYYGAAELHAYRATLSVQELVDQLRQYDAEGHKTQPTK